MRTDLTADVDGLTLNAFFYEGSSLNIEIKKNQTLFCLPGGGSSAAYFDLSRDHSFVERMLHFGYNVIVMDCPGTATNALPDNTAFISPRKMADHIASALSKWLESGSLKKSPVIGVGHSMGGMLITLMQARHKSFQAIAMFGSSAGGLEWGLSEDEKKYIDQEESFSKDIEKLTIKKFGRYFTPAPAGPSGKSITFGGETPELTQRLRDASCELYCAGGMMSMTRGSFKTEVEAIDMPIFFAFGDHDIGIPPSDAPRDYINAASTDLIVLENTGHNHFAFSSISTLCKSLDSWICKI